MEAFINKEAKKLKSDVLREFMGRKKWDMRSLSQMIDERIGKFNKRVQKRLEKRIYDDILGGFGENLPEVVPTPAKLSEMLYHNAKEASARLSHIFREHGAGKKTLLELARTLYDGYGFRSKEMLDVRKKMPKYVNDYLRGVKTKKDFEREISKLKTRPLRIAYRQISEVSEKHNKKAIDKATRVALEEKARYYANRIAQTEQQRAISLARAKQYFEDEEIEFVKYRMSSKHPMVDICDYYANLDVGYGKGIVPKDQMITLPLHPHCMCRYDPYYKRVRKRTVKDPEKETLKQFSKWERSRILGSYDALRKWENGESVESIFNSARPKYPIVKALAVFAAKRVFNEDVITKNEKEAIVSWTVDSSEIKKVMWGISDDQDAKKYADTLFSLFDKYDTNLEKGVKLYRGMSFTEDDFKYYGYNRITKGEWHIPDSKAIVSFSSSKRKAFEYAIIGGRKYKVVYIVENESEALDISKISAKPEEKESIITKGKMYLVVYTKIFNRGDEIWKVIKLKKEE